MTFDKMVVFDLSLELFILDLLLLEVFHDLLVLLVHLLGVDLSVGLRQLLVLFYDLLLVLRELLQTLVPLVHLFLHLVLFLLQFLFFLAHQLLEGNVVLVGLVLALLVLLLHLLGVLVLGVLQLVHHVLALICLFGKFVLALVGLVLLDDYTFMLGLLDVLLSLLLLFHAQPVFFLLLGLKVLLPGLFLLGSQLLLSLLFMLGCLDLLVHEVLSGRLFLVFLVQFLFSLFLLGLHVFLPTSFFLGLHLLVGCSCLFFPFALLFNAFLGPGLFLLAALVTFIALPLDGIEILLHLAFLHEHVVLDVCLALFLVEDGADLVLLPPLHFVNDHLFPFLLVDEHPLFREDGRVHVALGESGFGHPG